VNYPTLKRGSRGKNVRLLQSKLNKIGGMLLPDGDFGGGTERAVNYAQECAGLPVSGIADDSLWQWLDQQADPFPLLDTDGVAFIAKEETGGLAYYNQITQWPHFPGHESGITIGVGYDLRFNSLRDFKASWRSYLTPVVIKELSADIGKKGSKRRANQLKQQGITIPFAAAWAVLVQLTLPRYYTLTESVYPSLSSLPPRCRSALVSIAFNRGSDTRRPRREEMKNIQSILRAAEDPGLRPAQKKLVLRDVEDQIIAMKRLWPAGSGLLKRRDGEAALWRQGLEHL
jgi:peptidoglycan hydrolase-like protein with peptidoglycan-binding domain